MSRRRRIVALAVLGLALVAEHAAGQPSSAQPTSGRGSGVASGVVALTIEGGGSLGAYEAGMSWALIEAFRQRRLLDSGSTSGIARGNTRTLALLPRLDLVTSAGASAGSINALLASIAWCSAAAAQPPESSAFWRAWMPSGVTQLLPEPRTPEWGERGIFTPRHLRDDVLPDVRRAWSRGGSIRGCRVGFGATVTKASADSVLVAKGLYARNQRFAAAAVVGAPEGGTGAGPVFTEPALGTQSFGPTGYLLSLPDSGGAIASSDVEQLLMASSAYPLAFAPAKLRYCRTPQSAEPNEHVACARPDSGDFLDGGIFDNGPLALAYDLAHATDAARARKGLYLLYVTPDRRRAGRDPRRDMFLARAAGAPAGGSTSAPSGLDAGLALIGNFIPAARQYELQLAGRMLPQSASVEQQLARKEADLVATSENARRFAALADSEHAAHVRAANASDSAWAHAIADESVQRRQAQFVGAICRIRPAECGVASALDSLIARAGVDSIPPTVIPAPTNVEEPQAPQHATPDSISSGDFSHTFFVSTRWHPLAGEWLSGIGAFLGEPLREYDFYVGVYDALALMTRDAICVSDAAASTCVARTLHELVDDPPLVLSPSARLALHALYRAEYPSGGGRGSSSQEEAAAVAPVTPHDSLLVAVIAAMQERMQEDYEPPRKCPRSGSFIQRAACLEGIDVFFAALRSDAAAMRAIRGSAAACDDGATRADMCYADGAFLRMVRNPGRELNRISERALQRLDEVTPAGGATKPLLILAMATYYSTNEAARGGWDFGSTSLPSSLYAAACDSLDFGNPTLRQVRRCSQAALRIYPSSVGIPLFPSSAQYAEWTVRYNWPGTYSAGFVTRLMTSNGRGLQGESSPRMVEAPGIRFERKLGTLLVPTVGLDLAYWLDSNHSLFHQPAVGRAAYGATATILASKLRFSVTRIPDGYRSKGTRTLLWTAGIGDVNGMVYWLWRLTTE